jgi:hypothetical protein
VVSTAAPEKSMNNALAQSGSSLNVARRLVERATTDHSGHAAAGPALQQTCTRVLGNLRESLGDDGCNALLARALARTEGAHPPLKKIRRLYGDTIHLDGVAASVETFGAPAVTAAVESLFAALVAVLGRLIGEDMAVRLIDSDPWHVQTH